MKMTKKAMVEYIGSTGMVIDFDAKFLMRHSVEYVERLYNAAIAFSARNNK